MELSELNELLLWARTLEFRANNMSYSTDPDFTDLNVFVNRIIEKLDWSVSHSELNFTSVWFDDVVAKIKKTNSVEKKKDKKDLYKEILISSNKALSSYMEMLKAKIEFTKYGGK